MDLIKLPPFSNVAANVLATLSTTLLNGMNLHGLIFKLSGTTFTRAHLSSIQLRLGGKVLIPQISGTQFATMNAQKGIIDNAGFLSMFFGNPTARTIRGQHLTDLDLSIYPHPLEFSIDIGAATAPKLECYALVTPPKMALGMGYGLEEAAILKAYIRTALNYSNAVTKAAADISIGSAAGAVIQSMNLFHSNLTALEVKKQGVVIFENIDDGLNDQVQVNYNRDPQAGLFVWQPTVDHNEGQAVTTVRADGSPYSFNFLLTTSAADNLTVYTEVGSKLGLL